MQSTNVRQKAKGSPKAPGAPESSRIVAGQCENSLPNEIVSWHLGSS